MNQNEDCAAGCDFMSPSTWTGPIPQDGNFDDIFIINNKSNNSSNTVVVINNIVGTNNSLFQIGSLFVQNAVIIIDFSLFEVISMYFIYYNLNHN